MNDYPVLDLVPNQAVRFKRVFENPEDEKRHQDAFAARVQPELDEQRRARQRSEERAMTHWVS